MNLMPDFDTLLNDILTDYCNQFPTVDTSQGSLVFIKSACLASALWGLYKHQEWVARQIFPDTCSSINLDRHAYFHALTRTYAEEDDSLLSRVLTAIRKPPAGGNANDYEQWALSIDNVAAAYCFPIPSGPGTVDVVILANEDTTGSEEPTDYTTLSGTITTVTPQALVDSAATFISSGVAPGDQAANTVTGETSAVISVDSETQLTLESDIFDSAGLAYEVRSLCVQVVTYIDSVRPVSKGSVCSVVGPTIVTQAVTVAITGTVDTTALQTAISDYMQTLTPQQPFYISRILQLCLEAGADNAVVSTPAADVIPTDYQMIRPGEINVS
jgi:uncharacterized phage protein gp47/JayE